MICPFPCSFCLSSFVSPTPHHPPPLFFFVLLGTPRSNFKVQRVGCGRQRNFSQSALHPLLASVYICFFFCFFLYKLMTSSSSAALRGWSVLLKGTGYYEVVHGRGIARRKPKNTCDQVCLSALQSDCL